MVSVYKNVMHVKCLQSALKVLLQFLKCLLSFCRHKVMVEITTCKYIMNYLDIGLYQCWPHIQFDK